MHDAIEQMRGEGLPVRAISPQGAIYLSAQFDLIGRSFKTNEEIRRFLLERAGLAVVPFQAFGTKRDDGWFRLSAGAVSPDAIRAGFDRVRDALRSLQ
jgi:aspartate aminotransferase